MLESFQHMRITDDASRSGRTFPAPNAGGAGRGLKGFQRSFMQATQVTSRLQVDGILQPSNSWIAFTYDSIIGCQVDSESCQMPV